MDWPIATVELSSSLIIGFSGGANSTLTVILTSSIPSPPPTGVSVLSAITTNSWPSNSAGTNQVIEAESATFCKAPPLTYSEPTPPLAYKSYISFVCKYTSACPCKAHAEMTIEVPASNFKSSPDNST